MTGYISDRSGTVAIVTAAGLPVILLALLGGTTVMKAMSQKRELQALAQTVCNRALKPTRTIAMDDATRRTNAESMFTRLAAERGLNIRSKSVTTGWLTGQIDASAIITVVPGFNQTAMQVSVSEHCAGIPPYPKLMDVVLSSNFKTPTGANIGLTEDHGGLGEPWGVFTPQAVGWDGGSGSGVEIQDWTNGFTAFEKSGKSYLPSGVTNPYVVELDSATPGKRKPKATCGMKGEQHNSSMYKNFELHPGTYRISLWYIPRISQAKDVDSYGQPNSPQESTNRLAVYLEGTKPVTPKQLVLQMPNVPVPLPSELTRAWTKRAFEVPVPSYGLYRLTVAAEGCSDSSGGNFNDLKIEYIKRPQPEYNDPTPPLN